MSITTVEQPNVFFSNDLTQQFRIRINTLVGIQKNFTPPKNTIIEYIKCPLFKTIESSLSDIFITATLYSPKRIYSAVATKYISHTNREKKWKKWLTFPIKICELSSDTWINFSIYDSFSPLRRRLIGGTSIKIFNEKNMMFRGSKRLRVWLNERGNCERTPGEIEVLSEKSVNGTNGKNENDAIDEITRIETLLERTSRKFILNWLDKKFWHKYNQTIIKSEKKVLESSTVKLYIDFPQFDSPVIYRKSKFFKRIKNSLEDTFEQVQMSEVKSKKKHPFETYNYHTGTFFDSDYMGDVPPVKMHANFMQNVYLRDVKNIDPTIKEFRILQKVFRKTWLEKLNENEKILLWKYRYWIKKKKIKSGIIKVLRAINWEFGEIKREAFECLKYWNEFELNCDMSRIHDVLELLSKRFSKIFYNIKKKRVYPVREYAVKMLDRLYKVESERKRILNVLLQIVQSLKYEKNFTVSNLAKFLLKWSSFDFGFASKFFWFLNVEVDNESESSSGYKELKGMLMSRISKEFKEEIEKGVSLFENLSIVSKQLKQMKGNRKDKMEMLKKIVKTLSVQWGVFPLKLPLDTSITVTGIDTKGLYIFKSAMQPLIIPFITSEKNVYKTIFKEGDDLRQDQLVVQVMKIMNEILQKNAIDLKITPYKVLACNKSGGFLECVVPNSALHKILYEKKLTIRKWLSNFSKTKTSLLLALDNYMKSLAGYTIITYILGIGDRHLDNLLLKRDGKLFHVDFGFILGAMPRKDAYIYTEMKLNKEMLQALGGEKSDKYIDFLANCVSCYNVLRKYAPLLMNMFLLMMDSGILDAHKKNAIDKLRLEKLQSKLQIGRNDQEAGSFIRNVIYRNQNAIGGRIVDFSHGLAQNFRN